MSEKSFNILIKVIAWLLIGSILLWAAFFTYANGFKKISFGYEQNDVYEIDNRLLNPMSAAKNEEDYYLASFQVLTFLDKLKLNYFRLYARNINDKSVLLTIQGAEGSTEYIEKFTIEDVPVHNGINDIEIPTSEINIFTIELKGASCESIRKAEFRESVDTISIAQALPFMLSIFTIYAVLTGVYIYIARKTGWSIAGIIESAFAYRENTRRGRLVLRISGRTASRIRVCVYLIMFTCSLVFERAMAYEKRWVLYLAIQILLMLLLTLLLCDSNAKRRTYNIDYNMAAVYLVFASFTLLSDILVEKRFRFEGAAVFILLVAISNLWCGRDNREELTKEFEKSVHLFLILLVVLTIVDNQPAIPGRLSGPISNPSVYALYLVGILAVLLGALENSVRSGAGIVKKLTLSFELAVTFILCLMSQSLCPLIAATIVMVIWAYRILSYFRGRALANRILLIVCICGLTTSVLILWQINNIPVLSGTRLADKLGSGNISEILSNRDYYYKLYLRNMNLLGHSKKPFLWDHRILPHNAVLGMAYTYGVPAAVPYILLMITAIKKSWNYAAQDMKNATIPMYCIVSFVIMSMADNVEQPFVWLPWIACYIMFAPIMLTKNEHTTCDN